MAEARGVNLRTRESGYKRYPLTSLDLAPKLLVALDHVWDDADAERARIAQGVRVALTRLDGMGTWLRDQLEKAL